MQPFASQLAQWGPVAFGIGSVVRGFQQGPQLFLRILVDEPLDVPVQQLDGRVERVVSAVLISL